MSNATPQHLKPSYAAAFVQVLTSLSGLGTFFQAVLVAMIGAGIAGWQGLAPHIEPLLESPKFSAILLITVGLYGCFSWISTTAIARLAKRRGVQQTTNETNIWAPVGMVVIASLLLPMEEGMSSVAHALLWAARTGAGA